MRFLRDVSMLSAVLAASLTAMAADESGPNPEQLFQQLDRNSDGQLTSDEVGEEQARFFERLVRVGDENSDKQLSRGEFLAAMKAGNGPVTGENALRINGGRPQGQIFERLDRNGDGKVTLEEVPEEMRDRIRPLFERLGKESLSREDFEKAGRAPGGPEGGRPDGQFFERFDRNGDGKVTLEEVPEEMRDRIRPLFERLGKESLSREDFEKAGRGPGGPEGRRPDGQFFERFDRNGDGKVTLDEVPEEGRERFRGLLQRLGKDENGSVTREDMMKAFAQRGRDGRPEGREPGDRGPEGRRPEGRDGRPEGRRPGDRGPEGRRPEGPPPERERFGRMDGPEGRGRRGGPPAFIRMLDTNEDGQISRDELNNASTLFDKLDHNKDGKLDPPELMGFGPGDGPGPRDGFGPPRDGEERRRPQGRRGPGRDGDRPNRNRPDEDRPNRERPDGERPPRERSDSDGPKA